MPITRTRPPLVLASLLALAFAVAGALQAQVAPPTAPSAFTDDPDAVVIAFADTELTLAQFDEVFAQAARSTAIGQGMPVTDEVLAEFEPFKAAFLEQYGTQLVLAHVAETRGLAPSDAEVDTVIETLRREQPDAAAFDAWLDAAGYADTDDLRGTVSLTLSAQALVDDLATGVEVAAADVRAWYDANPDAVRTEDGEMVPFEAVEPQIEQLLVQEAVDVEVQLLVAQAGLELYPEGR